MKIKKIPKLFVVSFFLIAAIMVVWGYIKSDFLFYIRAGIFALAALVAILLNKGKKRKGGKNG